MSGFAPYQHGASAKTSTAIAVIMAIWLVDENTWTLGLEASRDCAGKSVVKAGKDLAKPQVGEKIARSQPCSP
jgi:hypothetical protein